MCWVVATSARPAVGAWRHPDGMGDFDAAAYLPRARRLGDLSQRELATRLGVHQSSVARWESGAAAVPLATFVEALSVSGLRLAVVDAEGHEVPPFERDVVRDNAARRFPAHLDVAPPWPAPRNRGNGRRYDRPPARAWYALRRTRAQPPDRPSDHPTRSALAPCTCADDCLLLPRCPSTCACRCEPAGGAAPHTVTP